MKTALKFRKSVFLRNLPRIELYQRKPHILFQDKIILKFGQNKWERLVLGKVYEYYSKIKEKWYFTKLSFKRVISICNPIFGSKIR